MAVTLRKRSAKYVSAQLMLREPGSMFWGRSAQANRVSKSMVEWNGGALGGKRPPGVAESRDRVRRAASAAFAPRLCLLLQRRARPHPAERRTDGSAERDSAVTGRRNRWSPACGWSSPPVCLARGGVVAGLQRSGTGDGGVGRFLITHSHMGATSTEEERIFYRNAGDVRADGTSATRSVRCDGPAEEVTSGSCAVGAVGTRPGRP